MSSGAVSTATTSTDQSAAGTPSASTTSTDSSAASTAASDSSASSSSSSESFTTTSATTPAADSSTPPAGDTTPAAATVAAETTSPSETSSTPATAATTPADAATVAATTTKPGQDSSSTTRPGTATSFAATTDPAGTVSTKSAATQNSAATFDPTATPATDAVKSFVDAVAQLPSLLQPIAPGLVEPLTQLMAVLPKLLAPALTFMARVETIVRTIVHALAPDWTGGQQPGTVEMRTEAKSTLATWTTAIAMVAPAVMAPAVMPAAGQLPGSVPALTPQMLSAPFGLEVSPPQATIPASSGNPLANLPHQIAQALRDALRTLSLAELALAALPGLAGLLVFFATGVKMGHRQAKFGFAMEMTGIMRFAPTGPLGIVRTGSFVAVSAKKTAAVPAQPKARRGRRHLELVA